MINETNLTKLAFVLAANGGGSGSGSSSGGGVMVIGVDGTVLDKTWQEIYDCVSDGVFPVLMMVGKNNAEIAYIDGIHGDDIVAHVVADGQIQQVTFTVDSPNDYPVTYTGDDSGDDGDGSGDTP